MYKYSMIAILVLAALAMSACNTFVNNGDTIRGSGNVINETRDVSGFSGIRLEGSGDVVIRITGEESLEVEAEDNIMPLLVTEVRNGVLVLTTEPNTSISTTRGINYTITADSLDSLALTGSGNITVSALEGDDLSVVLSGSGNVELAGSADGLTIELAGSGNVRAYELAVDTVRLTVAGSGNVEVNASDSIEGALTGSGTVTYIGDADVSVSNVGSGSVRPR